MVGMDSTESLLTTWARLVQVSPELGWADGALVQFQLSDVPENQWIFDLRKPPRIFKGTVRYAAKVQCDSETLSRISHGEPLGGLLAEGHIQVIGDRDALGRFGLFLGELISLCGSKIYDSPT